MADIPSAVRILPMDSKKEEEFAGKSAEEVQQGFFLRVLPSEPKSGRYWFRKKGLKAGPGTVVLFQYDKRIIASATLGQVERFDEPEGDYHGILHFDVDSIRVFDPVGAERVREIWPKVKRFNQTKWPLDPAGYPAFERRLTGIEQPPPTAPAAPKAQDLEPPPADRVQTTVSRIVRDTRRANRVKLIHNYECQICGHTIILADGSLYAEAHHVQPLGGDHDGPDVEENIVCLCPNHHAACDLGAIRLSLDELRSADRHAVGRRYVNYHNRKMYRGSDRG